ncbi:hypothetical protein E1B28_002921 [Marasmius oreades]|uniref:Uncharacterized protein n=1 Tax=Marasmius oreades TaxID=181124 RepID=A0A9P7UK12_9AGAR|nr:uncharacterized protein E1B28_002921 [Marasmius oreades]KAG7085355.1 hypothetical protein E1B28_002921 [Marasmius oreades]
MVHQYALASFSQDVINLCKLPNEPDVTPDAITDPRDCEATVTSEPECVMTPVTNRNDSPPRTDPPTTPATSPFLAQPILTTNALVDTIPDPTALNPTNPPTPATSAVFAQPISTSNAPLDTQLYPATLPYKPIVSTLSEASTLGKAATSNQAVTMACTQQPSYQEILAFPGFSPQNNVNITMFENLDWTELARDRNIDWNEVSSVSNSWDKPSAGYLEPAPAGTITVDGDAGSVDGTVDDCTDLARVVKIHKPWRRSFL